MYWVALSLLAAGSSAAPLTSPMQPSQTAPQSIQQQFDAGTDAFVARDWKVALAIYEKLETALVARNPNSKSLPVVRLRKARALYWLERMNEAEPLLIASLDKLAIDDDNLKPERQLATIALGDIAERNFDYPGAVAHFKSAFELSDTAIEKLDALVRLIRVEIFVDPVSALVHADIGVALLASQPEANKNWPGVLLDLRGRTLLNLGRVKEARIDLDKAIKQLGRLSDGKMDLSDGAARSDAAIAAMRDNDQEAARRLIAYSGAAQQSYKQFRQGVEMEPPSCAVNGPNPEDVAVIELAIREDGSVSMARPVYFSGKPSVAVEYAKAVAGWSWTQDQMKDIDLFYRMQTRIELRCTSVFARLNPTAMLESAFENSLAAIGVKTFASEDVSDARAVALLKTELARRESKFGSSSPQLIPVLDKLRKNAVVEWQPSAKHAQRALELGITAKLPAQALVYLGLSRWQYIFWEERNARFGKYKAQIEKALSNADYAGDAQAASALRLQLFDFTPAKLRDADAKILLQLLVDDKRLLPNDPFRVGALTRLASLDYRAGRVEAARANFEQSGLSTQQCALVDASPVQVKGRVTAGDYPEGAEEWGFSGWTVIEFDIDADGVPRHHRAVASFPPFIFGPAVIKRMQGFQYQQSYRPGGGLGCGGMRQGSYFNYAPTKDTSPPRKPPRP